jgi:transposase
MSFFATYSPDFNPIELLQRKMKFFLKRQKARTFENLIEVVNLALENVIKKNIFNCFNNCKYSTN